jgi:hypothetical protein
LNKSFVRAALFGTASWIVPAAPAAFLIPTQAQAQVICTDVLGGVECVDGLTTTATGTVNPGTVIIPGPGFVATSGGDLITTVTGDITTIGDNEPGVWLIATDDLIFALEGSVTTLGDNSDGVILTAGGDIDAITESIATFGDDSDGFVLTAENITAICGTVTTAGSNSIGIDATATGTLDLTCATVETTGEASEGVILQATDITADFGTVTTEGIGSDAITATATGDLDIVSETIATFGDDSDGFVLTAENITAICGTVTTAGNNSIGVNATATGTLDFTCATVETTGQASDGVILQGTDITANIGTVTTDGIGSDAITATATGDLDITSDTVVTLQDDSGGLVLTADNITAVCGTVTTSGANSIGVDATASGSINFSCASITTGGDNSAGLDLTGEGPITVIVGPVNTGGDDSPAIIIDGSDDSVNLTCGAIVTTGNNSPGVSVDAQGAITVNCESVTTDGDNSDGIQITGETGPVSVTVGPVITDGLESDGIDITTVTGDITVVAGPVTVTGPESDGISAVATGCADVNITATGAVLSADGTAILASSLCAVTVTTLPGASVTGADAGIDVTSGTGATITLNDSVQATDGPAINVDGAAAVINVNAGGSIIGRIDLTDNNDVVNNAGLFEVIGTSDFGAGFDVFNNLPTGIVSSTNGSGVLANCETFNNAGMITMIDGAPNDTLTVCRDYVGTGNASLGIDVGGGPGGLTADRLIIPGNASGSTAVIVNMLEGSAVIDPDGVMIVDAGTATGNPFSLAAPIPSAGLINFGLEQRGADTFLASRPDAAIFDLVTLARFGSDLWYQSSDAHLSCAAARRNAFGLAGRSPLSICGQAYYSEDRTGHGNRMGTVFNTPLTYSDQFKTRRWGAQLDVGYRPSNSLEFGVTGGYGQSNANLSSGSDFEARGYNVGLYAEYGMATGLYGGLLVKHDVSKLRFSNPLIVDLVRPQVKSTGIDGEVGWRTPTMGAMLDLNAGLSHVRTKMDDFDAGFIAFEDGRTKSLRGRVGARMTWTGNLGPFVEAKLFHEFDGDSSYRVGSGALIDRLAGPGRGTWGRLEGGLAGGAVGGPLLSAWIDVGNVRGWGVRAGYRFGGSAAPLAPMAAPPPPPPAPATRTCPDGTVVLATEMCPAPPPPPPPPAPAPERG